jgi:membrane protease YdiL (CAAX protease family)
MCVGVISVLSLALGYIQWDVKWPGITGIWGLNNLFFVCFPEEVFFRGFLQTQIKAQIPTKWHYYFSHIALSSVFFGIDHAVKGGIAYGFLTLIAGGFYG